MLNGFVYTLNIDYKVRPIELIKLFVTEIKSHTLIVARGYKNVSLEVVTRLKTWSQVITRLYRPLIGYKWLQGCIAG